MVTTRVQSQLRFKLAIANLPELYVFDQPRYPKGDPRGGQFKPKNTSRTVAADDTPVAKPGILKRATAAIATKLHALAARFNVQKSSSNIVPKGFREEKGRIGKLQLVDLVDPEEGRENRDTQIGSDKFQTTAYAIAFNETETHRSKLFYSEVSRTSKTDDNVYDIHAVNSNLNTLKREKSPLTKRLARAKKQLHEYSFSVDETFDQNQFATPETASQVMKAIKSDFMRAMSTVPDGDVVMVQPYDQDGRGSARSAAYKRMGFSTPVKVGSKSVMYALKQGNQLIPITPES
jgi:hypothetical protein